MRNTTTAVLLCATTAICQQSGVPQASQAETQKLASEISASYYHPDDLSSIDCGAVLDLTSMAKQLGQEATDEQMRAVRGMTVKLHAVRAQDPMIDIVWEHGIPSGRETIEGGVKQTLSGFFRIYWELFGSSMAPGPRDPVQIEEASRGGRVLHSTSNGMKVSIEVGADNLPMRFFVDSPAMKITMKPQFTTSQNPTPGDLRRLTSVAIAEQIGTNNINLGITMDYQDAEVFHIPRHVVFEIGGAYSIPMEFTSCSVTAKAATQSK